MVQPTGREVFFDKDELIVSKTDLKGRLTYANKIFLDIAGYTEEEVLGQPHSIIRHPDMPRCVFKLLWDTLAKGDEIFAYVVNMAKNGDHYWVLAHVTPSYDPDGNVIGYHSARRVPDPAIIKDVIVPLYKQLREIEESVPNSKEGMNLAYQAVVDLLAEKQLDYDEFVSSLDRAA